jgi:hypothetical protein
VAFCRAAARWWNRVRNNRENRAGSIELRAGVSLRNASQWNLAVPYVRRLLRSWQFSGSAEEPFSRPGLDIKGHGAERRGREERSHPQPRAAPFSEHGEDGEHRTFPAVSAMAYSASAGLPPVYNNHVEP